jgi:hypothetical protein
LYNLRLHIGLLQGELEKRLNRSVAAPTEAESVPHTSEERHARAKL